MASLKELASTREERMREVLPARFRLLSSQPSIILGATTLMGESGDWRWWSSASQVSNIGSGVYRARQFGRIDLFAQTDKQKRGVIDYNIRGMRDQCAFFECSIKPSDPDAEIWWSLSGGGQSRRLKAASTPSTNGSFVYYFGTDFLPHIVGSRIFALWQNTPATGGHKIWSLNRMSIYFAERQ